MMAATKELMGLKGSAWGKAQGTRNWPATKELPSLFSECSSFRAGRTLSATVAAGIPLLADVSGGVKACLASLVRCSISVHGMAKIELSHPLFPIQYPAFDGGTSHVSTWFSKVAFTGSGSILFPGDTV